MFFKRNAVGTVLNDFAADRSKSALICEKCGLDLKTKFLTGKLDDLKMGGYLETIKRPDILHKHKGHEGSQTYGQQGVFCVVIKINHA